MNYGITANSIDVNLLLEATGADVIPQSTQLLAKRTGRSSMSAKTGTRSYSAGPRRRRGRKRLIYGPELSPQEPDDLAETFR